MSGVVVTGGASGIGLASAEAVLAEGRQVCLWDLQPLVAESAAKLGVPYSQLDVTYDAAVAEAVEAAAAAMDGIDGLVHAAGVVRVEPLGALTADLWDA